MELVTGVLILVLIAFLTYYFGFKDLDFFKKNGIVHIPPLPFLGNMGTIVTGMEPFAFLIKRIYDLHPEARYVGMYDMMDPVVVIRDPELVKSLSVKHFEHFVDHRQFVDEVQDPLFGKNLFALRGAKWKDIRNMLSPAFTSSKMKSMFILMNNCAATFSEYMASLPEEQRDREMKESFNRYTTDVIATCAFGISVDSMKDPKNDFFVYGRDAANFDLIRTLKFFLLRNVPRLCRLVNMKLISDEVSNFFRKIIAATIKTRDEQNLRRPDMIQLMMDSRGKRDPGQELSIEDMTAQAFIFFFGGFDTTSILMSFTASELSVKPDVQKRLQEEIDDAMEKCGGQLTYEVVMGMEYLDAVLNEALRMYPVGANLDRVCTEEFELPPALPGGKPLKLKRGMSIWFPVYGFHHDPKYFPEPETFNPDRFLKNGRALANSGAYIPFGMGPRMCIGNRFALMETKVLLCQLLSRCNLVRSKKARVPLKLQRSGVAMQAEGGFWVKIEPRQNSPVCNGKAHG